MSVFGDCDDFKEKRAAAAWQDHCCGECPSCLQLHDNNNERSATQPLTNRFVTVGSVRYGVRLGAVSPPPPGAGPRYRTQCCWPSTVGAVPIAIATAAGGPVVSRIPLLPSKNSGDIFSCVNRSGGVDTDCDDDEHDECYYNNNDVDDDHNVNDGGGCCHNNNNNNNDEHQQQDESEEIGSSVLKAQLRRRVHIAPPTTTTTSVTKTVHHHHHHQVSYGRLYDCDTNLDRLPRFRFGGNRGSVNAKSRERDKRSADKELLFRELMDRRKKVPVPPPRTKHTPPTTPKQVVPAPPLNQPNASSSEQQTTSNVATQLPTFKTTDAETTSRSMPHRSASFSEVDYSTIENKYVMKAKDLNDPEGSERVTQYKNSDVHTNSSAISVATLPRMKTRSPILPSVALTKPSPDLTIAEEDKQEKSATSRDNENPSAITPRVSQVLQTSSEITQEAMPFVRNSGDKDNLAATQEQKQNKSRRRKGMYIDQWPNNVLVPSAADPLINELSNVVETKCCQSTDLNKDIATAIPQKAPSRCSTTSDTQTVVVNETPNIPKVQISSETDPPSDNSWGLSTTEPISPDDDLSQPDWSNRSSCSPTGTLRVKSSQLLRADSLSENEQDQLRTDVQPSDVSDCESRTSAGGDTPHIPRRYSKRPLRGPYGQMLEAEMKKPEAGRKHQYSDLKFLEDLSPLSPMPSSGSGGICSIVSLLSSSSMGAADQKSKYVAKTRGTSNHSLDDSQLKRASPTSSPIKQPVVNKRKVSVDSAASQELEGSGNKLVVTHQRTISSPSKLEGFITPEASTELLDHLLRGSSEQLAINDTRTHVVIELYDTERHYVESLQILITKYLEPLKSPENAGLLDAALVDEIFYQIPALHSHHNVFLEELKGRLDHWDLKQKVGDVLLSMYSNQAVTESYTNYVNNCKRAREIYKTAQQSKPAFARFLGAMAREHKGKLALDELLIKPIQIFPKYRLLLMRLIKHTSPAHPDYNLLLTAQREIHEQILKINCTEREALGLDQLREIEGLVEGLIELVASDRQYLRHDLVHMKASSGGLKERALFLFSDLLLITSIKRRSGTARRPNVGGQSCVASTLDANKYKLLMKISLDDLETVRAKDENFRQMMLEIEKLTEDISTLNQIQELVWSLHRGQGQLDDLVKEMLGNLSKQLNEQQNSDSQLCCLDLNVATTSELLSLVFAKPEKRASWEESFNDAKHKLAMSCDRRPCPELLATVPIRKTRAGLQFTCAAPTMVENARDVWVCNSDGYVGQICVLSLQSEPTVTSCNGVCNARILCIASVPGIHNSEPFNVDDGSKEITKPVKTTQSTIEFDSSSSSEYDERSDNEENEIGNRVSSIVKSAETVSTDSDDTDTSQSTMWLGTEDGCVQVFNCNDNIRIKKNKIRLQHGASILCIIYLDNRVFISLANGDLVIYERDAIGSWNTSSPTTLTIGTTQMPISRMIPNSGKLWCACGNIIKVINTDTLNVDNTHVINHDSYKPIACLVVFGNGVWLSLQNTAMVKCYHANTFDLLCEVNVAPAVTKMLTSCDDIIRQHKAACLRVTSLLACKDLLWIGTSAGVLLTMPLPHIAETTTKLANAPNVLGVPHGHTGHVRFLSHVEWSNSQTQDSQSQRHSYKGKSEQRNSAKVLVLSGGDGYEDFRNSNISDVAGREDSTNHLLLWNI